MKVIKKPVLPIQTCDLCGAKLKVELKDLIASHTVRNCYRCKVCKALNEAVFKNDKDKEV